MEAEAVRSLVFRGSCEPHELELQCSEEKQTGLIRILDVDLANGLFNKH